jgi:hypothetical protein
VSRLLDTRFKYTPAAATSVASTFKRFGFVVRSPEEQRAAAEAKLKGKAKKAKPLATVTRLERKSK